MGELIRNKWLVLVFIIIILLSLVARFYDLNKDGFRSDLYGTNTGDASAYVHNARIKVLFGEWKLEGDLWNPMYISPTLTFLQYISFKIFGVSTFASRIFPAVLGLLSVLFASFLLFLKNRDEGIIYFVLLIISAFLIAYSRFGSAEPIVLFFLLVVLGLVIYGKNYTWILAGFFAPFLFFSKTVSIFFILAIPTSLILYYFVYKDRKTIKNLFSFVIGFITSSILWLFWLVPRFDNWVFMNFAFGERILLTFTKPIGALYNSFQFLIKDPLVLILVTASMFIIIMSLLKKEKIQFIDFFLLISLILFYFQISILDMHLRRFVLILPLLLLMAARFISKIGKFDIKVGNKLFEVNRNTAILSILLVYAFINVMSLGAYFYDLYTDYDGAHSYVRVSKEIDNYIPSGSEVYGAFALAYSLDSKIKPYSLFENKFIDYENRAISLLAGDKIQYAILRHNLLDEHAVKMSETDPRKKPFDYIKSHFEIIATLSAKGWNHDSMALYIYKKKTDSNTSN